MSFTRLAAVILSCLAAAVLLLTAAWMLVGRGDQPQENLAVQIISPTDLPDPSHTTAAPDPAPDQSSDPAPDQTGIAVYVTGSVVNPGVYSVAADQRLKDVLDLAGGPTEDADLNRINLAAYVSDAAHYKIPSVNEPSDDVVREPVTGEAQNEVVGGSCDTPVNINTASAKCLESLPGIGGVRAASIVDYREQVGLFASVGDITAVSGIGDGTYRRIENMITVGGP